MTDGIVSPGLSPLSLRQAIEKAAAEQVPEGKHGAVVAVGVKTPTGESVRLALAQRIDDHWQLTAETTLEHHDGHPWQATGQIGVVGSW